MSRPLFDTAISPSMLIVAIADLRIDPALTPRLFSMPFHIYCFVARRFYSPYAALLLRGYFAKNEYIARRY